MWLLFFVAGVVVVSDRSTKYLVDAQLAGRPPVKVIPGVLQLTHTTNTGGAFGLSSGTPWVFGIASIAIAAVIVVTAGRVTTELQGVGLGLVLGGALGNLIDRLAGGIDFSGKVVDFIDFRVWPVFNLADTAVVVGMILLVVGYAKKDRGATDADG